MGLNKHFKLLRFGATAKLLNLFHSSNNLYLSALRKAVRDLAEKMFKWNRNKASANSSKKHEIQHNQN